MIRLPCLEWRAAGDDFGKLGAGRFRRRAPGKKGGLLLAGMVARFGRVTLKRPANLARQAGLAETVNVNLVEVCEVDAPPGAEPILWRLRFPWICRRFSP